MSAHPTDAPPVAHIKSVLKRIAGRTPVDMIAAAFEGDRLTLNAGCDSSGWTDFSVIFHDTAYMALPVYMNSVTMRLGDDSLRKSVASRFNALSETDFVFELVEDDDWPEGGKRHVVVAGAIECSLPAPGKAGGA